MKSCSRCGEVKSADRFYIQRRSADGLNPWCRDCYAEWHVARYATEHDRSVRTCAQCSGTYIPRQRRASTYCSRACKDDARGAALQAVIDAAKPARACIHCGADIGQDRRADAKFCSSECNSRAHALRRKLRARGGYAKDPGYLRLDIARRDDWTCGICAEPVDPALAHPDPACASLDHVVPVSHGGSSDAHNLRLTHLVCNLRRGNRTQGTRTS